MLIPTQMLTYYWGKLNTKHNIHYNMTMNNYNQTKILDVFLWSEVVRFEIISPQTMTIILLWVSTSLHRQSGNS